MLKTIILEKILRKTRTLSAANFRKARFGFRFNRHYSLPQRTRFVAHSSFFARL